MTRMSRSATAARALVASRSALTAALSRWHGLCFLFGSGCLFIAPFGDPPVNSAPEILSPEFEENDVVMDAFVETFIVVTSDPDEEEVYFEWDVPRGVEPLEENSKPNGELWVGTLSLASDPILDGSTLSCLVTDGEATRLISWRLEVP